MIKIIKIRGGLGNQMFGYAFYLMIKKKYPLNVVIFDPLEAWFAHNGIQLNKIFPEIRINSYKFYRRLHKIYSSNFSKYLFKEILENGYWGGTYNSEYIDCTSLFQIYNGFWQTEKYFEPVMNSVKKHFRFNTMLLNNKSVQLLNDIKACKAVSVHVRRTDYLEESAKKYFGDICTLEYYNKAINYMLQIEDNFIFYFFSDDPIWVKENFKVKKSIIVFHNSLADSWQDMYLMSSCKHNIIANSSFSWWGAWLNSNKSKIVIAPKKWTNLQLQKDIVPENWVRI